MDTPHAESPKSVHCAESGDGLDKLRGAAKLLSLYHTLRELAPTMPLSAGGAINRNRLIRLGLALGLYGCLIVPLANKPLTHDEVYYTRTYFRGLPSDTPSRTTAVRTAPYERWATDKSRQLSIHPPGVYLAYFAWLTMCGDSDLTMHLPAIVSGAMALVLLYCGALAVVTEDVAFWAVLLAACSPSFLTYAATAIPAMFECLLYLASLGLLYQVVAQGRTNRLPFLALANLLGCLTFYHYFVFLLAQGVILWRSNRRSRMSTLLSAVSVAAVMGMMFFIAFNQGEKRYEQAWWMAPTVTNLTTAVLRFPHLVEL